MYIYSTDNLIFISISGELISLLQIVLNSQNKGNNAAMQSASVKLSPRAALSNALIACMFPRIRICNFPNLNHQGFPVPFPQLFYL